MNKVTIINFSEKAIIEFNYVNCIQINLTQIKFQFSGTNFRAAFNEIN